jgi:beta-phosphoglucomutase-like phosphatase (HAD superfamily)
MLSHFDALVFDVDGVLLQSNHRKHHAMLALFDADAQVKAAIDLYNRNSGGIPRKQKFAHIWTQILKRTYDANVEQDLARAYAQALEQSLLDAPLVEVSQTSLPRAGCHASCARRRQRARQRACWRTRCAFRVW